MRTSLNQNDKFVHPSIWVCRFNRVFLYVSINLGVQIVQGDGAFTLHTHTPDGSIVTLENLNLILQLFSICRATTRPPRPSSTAECLRLIARLRGEQASAASWEPQPPFEATQMD